MGYLQQRNRRSSSSSSLILFSLFFVFFVAIFLEKSVGIVSALEYSNDKQASSLTLESVQKYLEKINKPAVMTIESPDGDIIDCIDQWKQPAFDHPLLKNHTLQLVPTEMPRVKGDYNNTSRKNGRGGWGEQVWHQNGTRCPEGTVPIRRITVDDVLRAESLQAFGKKPKTAFGRHAVSPDDIRNNGHEYAIVYSNTGHLVYGGNAAINVWNPSIGAENEMSVSQIWVANAAIDGSDLNTIEAGWMVYPYLYGNSRTRLFVYWTADGYQSTGCYNLMCTGFVQVDKNIAVGSAISPLSTISGVQKEAVIYIWKDPNTKNWWFGYGNDKIAVGYWPAGLFTSLKESALMVEWGGEVVNTKPNGAHTSTQMGSGRFAQEGFGKASFFRDLKVVDSNNGLNPPIITSSRVDNANCYNFDLRYKNNDWGVHFFYGGPGFNPNCP